MKGGGEGKGGNREMRGGGSRLAVINEGWEAKWKEGKQEKSEEERGRGKQGKNEEERGRGEQGKNEEERGRGKQGKSEGERGRGEQGKNKGEGGKGSCKVKDKIANSPVEYGMMQSRGK